MNEKIKFIIIALGIFCTYFLFGILQEKITRSDYGDKANPTKFTFPFTLVGMLCLWNWIVAQFLAVVKPEKKDETHFGYYVCISLAYLGAMVCSNAALRWVPYPAQVIAKSAKPIPVMILGLLIGRKTYRIQRYCFVLLMVTGVVVSMMEDKKVGKESKVSEHLIWGQVLLIVSLSLDGVLGAVQDRMRGTHAPTARHMMLAINGWSTIFLLPVVAWELFEFVPFVVQYPDVLIKLAMAAVTGAIGQLFILTMVASFGSLACAIVTTTRKFFTVIFSVIFFENTFNAMNWCGVALVFISLFADVFVGNKEISCGSSVSDAKTTTDEHSSESDNCLEKEEVKLSEAIA